LPALLRTQFTGVRATTCRGSAVDAVQVAVSRHLPSHKTWLVLIITMLHDL
jgi:hypothetical protein